jgi:cytochrome c peroxidase
LDYYIRRPVEIIDGYFNLHLWNNLLNSRYAVALLCCLVSPASSQAQDGPADLVSLGQALFFDPNLSLTRSQACSTCHEPARAFSDGRENDVGGAVSLGDDGVSLGDRNTPGISYANRVPDFHVNDDGEYVGGFFLDGRSKSMQLQAAEPLLNPIEMAMPNRKSVVERVRENAAYVEAFQSLFGPDVFADEDRAFDAAVASIVAFEQADLFSTFDSRYDRYLRGEYHMTREEELGRVLFFSQLISCHACHLLDTREAVRHELFTNHKYHNIGIPIHRAVRERNGVTEVDRGLSANSEVDDPAMAGKFRVPSLRNVAVTAPYMHNGIFNELETAILFYDKYLVSNEIIELNPETHEKWGEPEIAETIDFELLKQGQPITEERVRALVAFLKTLTDQRYEAMLDSP